ncbi:unnamed protein product [Brachionus calyciflorus]|uniref:Uncharacterized protein n=1 Tax=Brachionus calyciflorus TaxID=104777 RepID=A0A814CW70_9BILA|nr:unnamed protein product [Brachionus calyciflorus]
MKSLNYKIILIILLLPAVFVYKLDSLNRNKRDNCVRKASFGIVQSSLISLNKFLKTTLDLTSIIGLLGTISQVTETIFDFNSVSNCDLNNELKNIVEKIENLESTVKCEWHKHYYREILSKLEHLIDFYNKYTQKKSNLSLDPIRKVCESDTEGISKIYSLIKMLFKQNELMANIENCCNYKTNLVNNLFARLISLSTLFVTSLKICEEALNIKTDFNTSVFYQDITQYVNYYTKQAILERFVIDKGYYGLDSSIKRLANKSVSLESFQNDYDFFKWKVVYVVNHYLNCYSEEAWKLKCSPRYLNWINTDSIFCSAKTVYTEISYQQIHALISWYHKDVKEDSSSNSVFENYDLAHDREEMLNYVVNKAKPLNFAITVLKGGIVFNMMNPVESFGGVNFKRLSKWFHGTYDTFWSKWYPKSEVIHPKFTQSAIFLPNKNSFFKDLIDFF